MEKALLQDHGEPHEPLLETWNWLSRLSGALMRSTLLNLRTSSQSFPCSFKIFEVHSQSFLEMLPSLNSLHTIIYRHSSLFTSLHSFPLFLAAVFSLTS